MDETYAYDLYFSSFICIWGGRKKGIESQATLVFGDKGRPLDVILGFAMLSKSTA